MIRGDVGVRTAADIVLREPLGVERTQNTQDVEQRLRVEDVVDDALQRHKQVEHTGQL